MTQDTQSAEAVPKEKVKDTSPQAKQRRPPSSFRILLGRMGADKPKMLGSILLAMVGVIAGIIPYVIGARILTDIIQQTLTTKQLLILCTWGLVFYILKSVLLMCSTLISHHLAYRVLEDLRADLAGKLTSVPLGKVISTPSGSLKKVFMEDISACEVPLAHFIPELSANLLGPIAVIVYLFVVDYRLALASLVPVVAAFVVMLLMMSSSMKMYGRYFQAKSRMNSTVVEFIRGIEVVKAFGQSKSSYQKLEDDIRGFKKFVLAWYKVGQTYFAVAITFMSSGFLVLLPLGAWLLQGGHITLIDLLLSCCLALAIGGPLLQALTLMDSSTMISTSMAEVFKWMMVPDLVRPEQPVEISDKDFEVSNLSFSYEAEQEQKSSEELFADPDEQDKITHVPAQNPANRPTKVPATLDPGAPAPAEPAPAEPAAKALDGASLEIPENHFVAIVGPSGSGKSTLARLLVSYWDPDEGRINFSGQNIRNIPTSQLMDNVGLVAQDTFLYDTSIAENMRVANLAATDEEIAAALHSAGCDDFISRLPQGINTQVGGSGTHLSGGERQRVTLARALLKDSPVVILDEATAYIDPENEDRIQDALGALTGGKTLMVVAHRLFTIRGADTIYVFDHGKVIENGNHDELLAANGLYASMWATHTAARTAAIGEGIN